MAAGDVRGAPAPWSSVPYYWGFERLVERGAKRWAPLGRKVVFLALVDRKNPWGCPCKNSWM
jgi:hypothetical protein